MDAVKKIENLTQEQMRQILNSVLCDLASRTYVFEEEICDRIETTFNLFGVKVTYEP